MFTNLFPTNNVIYFLCSKHWASDKAYTALNCIAKALIHKPLLMQNIHYIRGMGIKWCNVIFVGPLARSRKGKGQYACACQEDHCWKPSWTREQQLSSPSNMIVQCNIARHRRRGPWMSSRVSPQMSSALPRFTPHHSLYWSTCGHCGDPDETSQVLRTNVLVAQVLDVLCIEELSILNRMWILSPRLPLTRLLDQDRIISKYQQQTVKKLRLRALSLSPQVHSLKCTLTELRRNCYRITSASLSMAMHGWTLACVCCSMQLVHLKYSHVTAGENKPWEPLKVYGAFLMHDDHHGLCDCERRPASDSGWLSSLPTVVGGCRTLDRILVDVAILRAPSSTPTPKHPKLRP